MSAEPRLVARCSCSRLRTSAPGGLVLVTVRLSTGMPRSPPPVGSHSATRAIGTAASPYLRAFDTASASTTPSTLVVDAQRLRVGGDAHGRALGAGGGLERGGDVDGGARRWCTIPLRD